MAVAMCSPAGLDDTEQDVTQVATMDRNETAGEDALGFRPLYRQVRDMLVRRLADGIWPAGALLPSEMQLAAELGVSQGTVRKALDAMASENLVVRRQGKGTFVATHDEERIMFQFFKLVPDSGQRVFPDSQVLSVARSRANAGEQEVLNLSRMSEVVRITRLRSIAGRPAIVETISLPADTFREIEVMELPNNLYGLYALHFGVTIAKSDEKLKAVAATADEAAALQLPPGAPVLQISRIAYSLDGAPVEWRLSTCNTDAQHYHSELR